MDDYIKREDALDIVADNNVHSEITLNRYDKIIDGIYEIPSEDVVPIELVAEMFDNNEPCNFGFQGVGIDDFMFSECGDWCESNCESVPALECWKQFFKVWEERKSQWIKQN